MPVYCIASDVNSKYVFSSCPNSRFAHFPSFADPPGPHAKSSERTVALNSARKNGMPKPHSTTKIPIRTAETVARPTTIILLDFFLMLFSTFLRFSSQVDEKHRHLWLPVKHAVCR